MSATVHSLAKDVLSYFETKERGETTIYFLRETAPNWISDILFEVHGRGAIFPHNWLYEAMWDALTHIVETVDADANDSRFSDAAGEFADAHVPPYTADRLAWLHTYSGAVEAVDEAVEELGHHDAGGIVGDIGYGMYRALEQVFHTLLNGLRLERERLNDETDEEADEVDATA